MVLKGETFPEMVAIMAHEYGHFMGLPELYDRSGFNHLIKQRRNAWIAHHTEGDPLPLATDVFTKLYNADLRQQSAGIGYWSVMGGGSLKWYYPDNPEDTRSFPPPQPMGAWSRVFADWVTDVEIAESGTFTLNDMSAETKVYKISIGGTQQYFLIENRQNTFTEESVGSMYADHGAMSGLMIWHIDENTGYGSIDANEWEERKGVDLESAEGLFVAHGGSAKDTENGNDDLDNHHYVIDATVPEYPQQNWNGNQGDDNDLWDGTVSTTMDRANFTPESNPSSNGYEPWTKPTARFVTREDADGNKYHESHPNTRQNVFSGIYIENIRSGTDDGAMDFDVIFAPMTPRNLDAVIGDRRIELLWDAPHPNGAVISSYTVRYRAIPTETETWTPATDVSNTATRYVIPNLSNGQKYEFEVFAIGTAYSNSLYSYAAKTGGKAKVIAAPQGNLYGDPEPEFDEIIDPASAWNNSISKYEKSGTVTWTLTGDDHLLLELLGTESGFRTLHFKSAPDFENALDADSDNVYEVTVNALPVSTGSRAVTPFTLDVSVEVTNVEEKGSVSFSHRDPVAGETLVATVTDPDEINEGSLGWEWNRNWTPFNPSSYEDFKHEKLPHITTGSFDVTGDDVGWTFGVIVSYTDGFSPENRITLDRQTTSITKGPIIPLASAPLPEGSAAVVLGAVVNDADGNPITQGVTWSLDLDRGDEQQDEAEFTISADGALRFKETPNYEQPTSSVDATATLAERNVYTAQLVASVGNVSIKGTATVTVTDVDEDGTVTLSTTTPVVGAEVTGALEDPDVPVTNELWTWQRRLPDSETVEDARAPLQSLDDLFQPTFTPSVLDVGRELRASVSYRDVHSSSDGFGLSLLDKSAHSVWTEPVSHGPTYLQVDTESGGLQFVVSTCPLPLREPGPECPAPTGGLLFTLDHVALERCTGPSSDETCVEFTGADLVELVTGGIPSGVPGERSSQARGRVSSSLTFSAPVAAVDNRLDNRKTYRFRAYLVGPGEQESPKSDAVTVLGLRAEARAGAVGLSWDAPAGLTGITGWSYRYKQEGGTWDADSWQTIGTGATVTTVEVEGLTNGVSYEFQVRALLGAETGPESFVVSATPDTRGRVEWSTTQPRVGQELTPTLIDPDNPALAEARWRWRRQRWSRSDDGDSLAAPVPGSRSGESKLGVIARTRQYTPQVSDLHQWLWVEVTYTDDYTDDSGRHRVSATTSRAVGPGPPCAPANLKAAPGDGQVTLTWEAGCVNGQTIDRYQYRRLEARKWVRVPGDGSARRQQVTGLTNGEAHTFEVQARNGQGWGPAAQATATPAAAESPPPPPPPPPLTVTYGASSYSAQEGGEAATVTVRLSPSASEALSIPITVNPPSGDFTVAGLTDGALSFSSGAERQTFTVTADQDDDTVDETVLLGFGDLPEEVSAGTPASATVTLFDDDVGTPVVSLSTTTPQVGQRMTATLTHLDGGLEAVAWQWQRRADGSSAWETLERTARYPITDLSRYTPVAADVGKQLRATVSYTDAHGASKSVQSAATDAVTWPPLTVTYGDSTYSASEGGAAATLTVRLSAEAEQLVKIPITRDPASGDYTVTWPGVEDTLSFSGSTTSQSFTITATEDDDTVDETVLVGFGDLPERVEAGTPASATVTLVDDTDHPGTVRLSTASPQVGRGMTATLVDGDGYLEAVAWQWQRRADGSSAWETLERTARYPITDLSRYTPVAADVGKQLRATVSYTDAHGASKSVQSAATDAVTWPPLTVTYGDSTYSASEGGAAATLTVRLSAEAEQLVKIPITRDPASGDYTVTWPGVEDTLSFSGSTTSQSFTITATEDDDTVDETVLVGFGDLPERVEAGTPASATVTLVDDTDHLGTVSLSTASPQVGRGMTATLVDGDGYLEAVAWQWQRRADAGSAWETLEQTARYPITDLSRYTPVAADAGKQLRATVSYTDAHGPDSAQSAATDAVTWPPLTVAYGDSTYSASEGGAAATLTVRLSAEAEQLVKIPITRDPASGDYTVTWPGVEDTLSFSGRTTSQSFTVTATEDDDEDDETVLVGFGALPERVEAGTPASATVTLVDDTDHPGTVRLSTASPEVGQRVTATLTDVDGGLEAVAWQWQRRADAGSAWVPIERSPRYPIVDQSHYTPVAADRGKQLRATVGYTDAHGPNKSAQSAATSAVRPADTPGTVRLSTASPEVGRRVTATLTDFDGALEAVAWQWQQRADAGSAWEPLEQPERNPDLIVDLSRYTPVAADRGKQLRATVGYTDGHGPDKSAQSAATSSVRPADTPGTVRLSTASPEVGRRVTATLTDFDGALEAVAWQWQQRADAGSAWEPLEQPERNPDLIVDLSRYTPVAADRGKQLRATVGYTDGHGPDKSAQSAATSSVRPADTPGTVRLSTASPEVGRRVTATLTDFDGALEAVAWQWQQRADAGSAWEPLEQPERNPDLIVDLSRYTPVAADRGKQLRATVGYTDGHGPDKSAQSAATSSVRPADTPGTVRLSTASPEVGRRVTATLTDFDGALEAVAWQWQQRADAGSAWEPLEQPERNPDLIVDLSRYTPVAADRGKQLRATVGYTDAHGPDKSAQSAATSSVRPADTPGTVRLSTASPEVGRRVTATLTDVDGALEAVAWQWQQRADAGSAWEPLEQPERNPDLIVDLSRYTPVAADRGKQLRATVGYTDAHGPDKSAQSAATSSVRPADTPGTVRLSTASPEVGRRVTATLTDVDGGLEAGGLAVAAAGGRGFGVGAYRAVGALPHCGPVPLHAGGRRPGQAAAGDGRLHRRPRSEQERAERGDVVGEAGRHPRHGATVDGVAGGGSADDGHPDGLRRRPGGGGLAVAAAGGRGFGVGAYRAVGALPHCGHVPLHAGDGGCGEAAAGAGGLRRRARAGQGGGQRRDRPGGHRAVGAEGFHRRGRQQAGGAVVAGPGLRRRPVPDGLRVPAPGRQRLLVGLDRGGHEYDPDGDRAEQRHDPPLRGAGAQRGRGGCGGQRLGDPGSAQPGPVFHQWPHQRLLRRERQRPGGPVHGQGPGRRRHHLVEDGYGGERFPAGGDRHDAHPHLRHGARLRGREVPPGDPRGQRRVAAGGANGEGEGNRRARAAGAALRGEGERAGQHGP